MPHQILPADTFDTLEDEILFTASAVAADPNAQDFVSLTAGWLGEVDAVRAADRQLRQQAAAADAKRAVANGQLDVACVQFGDALFLAVNKDRTSPRWRQFFSGAVSAFVKQALDKQVQTVQGWLQAPPGRDALLDQHRPALQQWATAAQDAITQTRGLATARGQVLLKREELAESLTRERDGLHEALAQRARDRGLGRDWPELFFRTIQGKHHAAGQTTQHDPNPPRPNPPLPPNPGPTP